MSSNVTPDPKARRAFAEKLAALRKERALRMDPMLDDFAVKLNREPTWGEINHAMQWILDIEECGGRPIP